MTRKSKLNSIQRVLAVNTPEASYMNRVPVKYAAYDEIAFYVVGIGGTGSWAAPKVVREAYFLQKAGKQVRVVMIDPDTVEEKNIFRQNFVPQEIGYSKAETMARRYSGFGLKVEAIAAPFDHRMVTGGYRTMSVLLGCVDNYLARREMAAAIDAQSHYLESARDAGRVPEKPLVWWIDSGNGEDAGQVVIGNTNRVRHLTYAFPTYRADQITHCTLLPSVTLIHPDLLQPPPPPAVTLVDAPETKLSCAEMSVAGLQSRSINPAMAEVMVSMLNLFLDGNLGTYATYYNIPAFSQIAKYITPENLARAIRQAPDFFQVQPEPNEEANAKGVARITTGDEDEGADEEVTGEPDDEWEEEAEFEYA